MTRGMCLLTCLLLCMLALCLTAHAEDRSDFLFVDGLTWESRVSDFQKAYGKNGKIFPNGDNGFRLLIEDLPASTISNSTCDFVLGYSKDGVLVDALYGFNLEADSFSQFYDDDYLDEVYGQLIDEVEQRYAGRYSTLCKDAGEVANLLETGVGTYDPYTTIAVLNARPWLSEIYWDDYSVLTRGCCYLIDEISFLFVTCSGTNLANARLIAYLVQPANETRAAYEYYPDIRETGTGYFSLPGGLTWGCSAEALETALQQSGAIYEATPGLLQVRYMDEEHFDGLYSYVLYFADDASSIYMAIFCFDDNTYDQVCDMLTKDYGEAFMEDDAVIIELVSSVVSSPDHVSYWTTAATSTYAAHSPEDQGVFVMQVSVAASKEAAGQ